MPTREKARWFGDAGFCVQCRINHYRVLFILLPDNVSYMFRSDINKISSSTASSLFYHFEPTTISIYLVESSSLHLPPSANWNHRSLVPTDFTHRSNRLNGLRMTETSSRTGRRNAFTSRCVGPLAVNNSLEQINIPVSLVEDSSLHLPLSSNWNHRSLSPTDFTHRSNRLNGLRITETS